MKLRARVYLFSAGILLVLAMFSAYSARVIMLDKFRRIESACAEDGIVRALNVIAHSLKGLDSQLEDWAYWGEAYRYAVDEDEAFVEDNLDPLSLAALGIDFIAIYDSNDRLIAAHAVDPWSGRAASLPEGWQDSVEGFAPFFRPANYLADTKGMMVIGETPYLISARQILTSERRGPTHGTMIMAMAVDRSRIERWQSSLREQIEVFVAGAEDNPPDVERAIRELSGDGAVLTSPLSADKIAGYKLQGDLADRADILIRMQMPRNIYLQARSGMLYFVAALFAFGLLFWAIIAVAAERTVLARILQLSAEVGEISAGEGKTMRVEVKGSDEIADLGRGINDMLARIKRSNEQIREINEQLTRANATKTEFTSIVSHELRTPLGTIKQAIELVQEGIDGELNDKQRQRLGIAKRNVDRLVRLTNDLLSLTRLETGRIEMNFEEADINELLADVYTLMKSGMDAEGIDFGLHLPQEHKSVVCDPEKIKQTVINLLNKATKFTSEGGAIYLREEILPDGVRIDVQDTGAGIKEDDMPKLFEPFRQIVEGKAKASEGSGLGLSICKLMVERHGGNIDVHSVYGEGSTFSVTLPDMPPDEPTPTDDLERL